VRTSWSLNTLQEQTIMQARRSPPVLDRYATIDTMRWTRRAKTKRQFYSYSNLSVNCIERRRNHHCSEEGAGSGRDHKSIRRSRRGWPRMRHDPMRQADIERRLSNMARARRRGARTRAGHPCRQAAVTGRARCRTPARLYSMRSIATAARRASRKSRSSTSMCHAGGQVVVGVWPL
jgi:hypothetical protein